MNKTCSTKELLAKLENMALGIQGKNLGLAQTSGFQFLINLNVRSHLGSHVYPLGRITTPTRIYDVAEKYGGQVETASFFFEHKNQTAEQIFIEERQKLSEFLDMEIDEESYKYMLIGASFSTLLPHQGLADLFDNGSESLQVRKEFLLGLASSIVEDIPLMAQVLANGLPLRFLPSSYTLPPSWLLKVSETNPPRDLLEETQFKLKFSTQPHEFEITHFPTIEKTNANH